MQLVSGQRCNFIWPGWWDCRSRENGKTSRFDKVITFDMGGTSTDVAHYENVYERVFDTVVAGVRITPMLLIIRLPLAADQFAGLIRAVFRSGRKVQVQFQGRPVTGAAGHWQ